MITILCSLRLTKKQNKNSILGELLKTEIFLSYDLSTVNLNTNPTGVTLSTYLPTGRKNNITI